MITHIDTFYDYTFDIINITKNKHKQSFVDYTRLFSRDDINHTCINDIDQLNKIQHSNPRNKIQQTKPRNKIQQSKPRNKKQQSKPRNKKQQTEIEV